MANSARASAPAVALAGVLSLAVAMGIGRFAFTPLLPPMIQAGGLDVAAGGWIAAANYAGYLAGALVAARVRVGAVRLGATALALTVLLTAAMAAPAGAWGWGMLRFAGGVCSAWAFVATAVWCLGELARGGHAHRAGAVYSGVGFGIAAAGLWCLAGASWGASAAALWLQLALLAAILLVPVALVLRRLDGAAPAARGPQPARAPLPPGSGGLVACYGVLGFGYILPATFLPVLARSIVDDPRLFGLAWPVFGATAAASTFIAAWALRHASRLQVWAVSNVVMGLGVLLPSVWLNGWTIALSALGVGGTFMIVTLAGVQEMRARASGDPTPHVARMTAAFAIGQIAGPIASSLLLHVPRFAQSGLHIALQAAAASLFLAAGWLWHAGRRSALLTPEIRHAP